MGPMSGRGHMMFKAHFPCVDCRPVLGGSLFYQEFPLDENLQIINKTKHPTEGEKGTRWKDPCLGKWKILQKGQTAKETWTNQVPNTFPSCKKHII